MNHADIIKTLGGPAAVARAAGRHPSRGVRWQQEGIPARCWGAIVRMPAAKAERITFEVLEDAAPKFGVTQ